MQSATRRLSVWQAATALGVAAASVVALALYWREGPRVPAVAPPAQIDSALDNARNALRPVLWVLSAGVSRYRDPVLSLRYAADDARALAQSLTRQEGGPLYSKVETRVLIDGEVTRASLLRAFEEFLGQAAPIDVGVIFLAGHGVSDPRYDTYYFLPADATATQPHIEGLDVGELNRQLRVVHRNLRRLVVILDTCHAGAVARDRSSGLGQDLAFRLAPAEGLYILASARSGEPSVELPSLGHGAFTHALLDGLSGATAGADGLITVFGLAGHAARVVRRLSEDRQHPYQAILGEDLVLAADPRHFAQITPPPLPTPAVVAAPARRERVAVVSFENLRPDPQQDWMQKALRQEFTTALASVTQLDVYDETEVRFLARGADDVIEAAQRAGMEKLVGGSYWVEEDHITITAHLRGLNPLQRLASARIDGPLAEFFTLRGRLVLALLDQIGVDLPLEQARRVLDAGSTDLAARKLLYGAEGGGGTSSGLQATPSATGRVAPGSSLGHRLLKLLAVSSVTYAAEADTPEAELRTTLEGYRMAFMNRDATALATYYLQFSHAQREALGQYFANADGLQVEFDDVRIAVIGERASVTFTRRDRFIDRDTGDTQQIVVRVTKLFARQPNGWRILPEE